jgi:hypothetical protein
MRAFRGIEKEERRLSRRQNLFALWILILLAGFLFFNWFQTMVVQRQMRRHKQWLEREAEHLYLMDQFERILYPCTLPGKEEERFPPRVQIPIILCTNLPGREGRSVFLANPSEDVWKRQVDELIVGEADPSGKDWLYLVAREEKGGLWRFFLVGADMDPRLSHEIDKDIFLAKIREAGLGVDLNFADRLPPSPGDIDLDMGTIAEREAKKAAAMEGRE